MVQEDVSGSMEWPGNVPASPSRRSRRGGSGTGDSPITGLKPLPPSRGNSRHASPTRARRTSAPSSPKGRRSSFHSSYTRLESEIDFKEDVGRMQSQTGLPPMMSPKSLERLVQVGRVPPSCQNCFSKGRARRHELNTDTKIGFCFLRRKDKRRNSKT
jgi:hypothetical protein